MIREFEGHKPDVHSTAFVHETAVVIGRVKLGPGVSVWPGVVLRGDVEGIEVGENANIQDGTVVHTDFGLPARIGPGVTVGHGVVLHGCRVERDALVGIGAVVLNGAVIEEGAVVGAGALVPPAMKVAAGQVVMGVPAKAVRPVKPEELSRNRDNAKLYVLLAEKHRRHGRPRIES